MELILFLDESVFYLVSIICLHSLKWFQILLSKVYSFICTQLNGFKHCYIILAIQLKQTVKEFQVLLFNTNNSIHYSFIRTQLNRSQYCYVSLTIQLNSHLFTSGQTVLYLKIQFNISHLFAHSLNIKQFYLTHS